MNNGAVNEAPPMVSESAMPLLVGHMTEEIRKGTALGATASVWHRGELVFDGAVGDRDNDQRLTPAHDVPWFSASKVAGSVAVARAWEQGAFELDEPVSTHLPEFSGGGKDAITCRDLWTHAAPLQAVDRSINTSMSWNHALERICAAEADTEPEDTGYLGHAGMLLLAEVVARRAAIPFADFFDREVAEPLGLTSRLGTPAEPADLVDVPFLRTAPTKIKFDASAGFPSNCVTGPIRDAARLCQLLVNRGRTAGQEILRPETVVALTSPQHSTPMDRRLGMPTTTGLGFAIDEYSFGRFCSPKTFGHSGARSSVAFGDPDAAVSAAIFFNGNCGLGDHVRRISAASSAVYCDLGLADPDDHGRDHPTPFGVAI